MLMLRRTTALLTCLVTLVFALASPPAAAHSSVRDCGHKFLHGSIPLPHKGRAHRVEITINEDCSVTTGKVQELGADEAQSNDEHASAAPGQGSQHRQKLPGIGSTPQYLDPDYHMDAHIWDCCNIIMTRLVTDLNWTTNGSTITGWNAGGYQAYHAEYSCGGGGGWYPVSSYLVQTAGNVGDVWIQVHAHAEWGYYGFFDACDGSVYYNVFDNWVWGDIRSIGGCDYGYYLRNTFQNWHLQIQCYNPLTTKFDYIYP
jgi:hypothetical protein